MSFKLEKKPENNTIGIVDIGPKNTPPCKKNIVINFNLVRLI